MERFHFSLNAEEKAYLKELALCAVAKRLSPGRTESPARPESSRLGEQYGAFVTLTKDGQLRGCIGNLTSDSPLEETIARMAQAAAFEDPRFSPVAAGELPDLGVDISILGPITLCPDPALVEVGRHGLIMRRGRLQGLLLPQVPVEWSWDRDTFLSQTCRKAGLPPDAWRDPQTEIYWFEAEVF